MKKIHYKASALSLTLVLSSCSGNNTKTHTKEEPTPEQKELVQTGWSLNAPEGGELEAKYGIKSVYGIQDNYFDIKIGNGCDVAIKIVDATTDRSIRYVYVPEGETVTISAIPQGLYYLKLAYGKDWMEQHTDSVILGKFTKSVFYERSTKLYNFGKKNSQNIVNYRLEINVVDCEAENNFYTEQISEEEFEKN